MSLRNYHCCPLTVSFLGIHESWESIFTSRDLLVSEHEGEAWGSVWDSPWTAGPAGYLWQGLLESMTCGSPALTSAATNSMTGSTLSYWQQPSSLPPSWRFMIHICNCWHIVVSMLHQVLAEYLHEPIFICFILICIEDYLLIFRQSLWLKKQVLYARMKFQAASGIAENRKKQVGNFLKSRTLQQMWPLL